MTTSRRNLIKTAAAAVPLAAGPVYAWAAQTPAPGPLPGHWDLTTDVLVAGSGIAGMSAALEAVDGGLKVLVLEKGENYGGCAYVSGGILKLEGGTRTQKAHGVDDSPEKLFKRVTNPKDRTMRKNPHDLARAYCEMLPGCQAWMEAHGVKFLDSFDKSGRDSQHLGSYHHVWWSDPGEARPKPQPGGGFMTGKGIMEPFKAHFLKKGGQILMQHKLIDLYRNDQGRVVGASVLVEGKKTINIRADKGVVLAGGSWKADKKLRKLTDPRFDENMFSSGWPFVAPDGSAILAGIRAGGMFVADRGEDSGHLRRKYGTSRYNWAKNSRYGYPGLEIGGRRWADLIFTNKYGERFCEEEDTPFKGEYWFYDLALAQPGVILWVVFDDAAAKKYRWSTQEPVCEPGYAFSAGTLAELAKLTDQPKLEETVARYNRFVDQKKDEDFGKPAPLLKSKIVQAPFHAARCVLGVHNLTGGLWIDVHARVRGLDGNPIEGLYAAGETAGGFYHSAQPRCMVSGRQAGQHIVSMK